MKKKALAPRAKRMKRSGRLQSARSWMLKYEGKNLVAGYRKHFAVDSICAVKELEMLGVKIDKTYKEQLRTTAANAAAAKRRKKAQALENTFPESDDHFAYIAGYTDAGFAYGVTWEEWNGLTSDSHSHEVDDDDFMIPF